MNTNDPSLVLVTGATGAVGPLVVRELCNAGYHVRSLSIDRPTAGVWPEGVDERTGDVTNPADVEAAMHGVGSVVHLAALLHIVNAGPELHHEYERINVGGTATVVRAAANGGVRRVVFFSTIAVYGQSAGKVLTEESPVQPENFYAQTKHTGERIVLDARAADGSHIGAVLRLAAVYGSRVKGNYRSLTRSLARNRFVPIGKGQNRRTLVYDKDVARAAVLAVEKPEAAGKVFNVSDGTFHTVRDIILSICEALGRRPPRMSLPVGVVRTAAGIAEDLAQFVGLRSPVNRAIIEKYTEDIAVDGGRICRELAFSPEYDLAAGWRETVSDMRMQGHL